MKSKKKLFGIIITVCIVLIVLVVAISIVFGNRILKTGIEIAAKHALQVDVTIDNVRLSPFRGTIILNNLVVDNPQGYNTPHLVTIGRANVVGNIPSLLSDTIEVEIIELDDVSLTLEQKVMSSNLQEVLKNLEDLGKDEVPEDPEVPEKIIRIDELHIYNVNVSARVLGGGTISMKLPTIKLQNVGTDEGVTLAELTGIVLLAIAGEVVEQGYDVLPTEMVNNIGQAALGAGAGILEDAGDFGRELGESIRNLF